MESAQEITIGPAIWSHEIAALIAHAGPVDDIERQVRTGVAEVFRGTMRGKLIVAFVLRIDRLANGNEGVIVAAAGNGEGVNLTHALLPFIERMFIDVSTVRIHTKRHGLAKKLVTEHGYEMSELVLTKKVQHGRQ